MNEILGERIKALRSGTHLTQEQVADKIGISRQKYARIENGTNNITLEILAQIAKVLGVQVADITRVLDETPVIAYRNGDTSGSSEKLQRCWICFMRISIFIRNYSMMILGRGVEEC